MNKLEHQAIQRIHRLAFEISESMHTIRVLRGTGTVPQQEYEFDECLTKLTELKMWSGSMKIRTPDDSPSIETSPVREAAQQVVHVRYNENGDNGWDLLNQAIAELADALQRPA